MLCHAPFWRKAEISTWPARLQFSAKRRGGSRSDPHGVGIDVMAVDMFQFSLDPQDINVLSEDPELDDREEEVSFQE